MDNILRHQLNELESYIPGRPIASVAKEFGLEKVIKLASNEWPEGPFDEVKKVINDLLPDLNRYPDGDFVLIKEAISNYLKVPLDQLLVGNGSNELLRIAGQAVLNPADEVIFAEPSFMLYKMIALLFEAKPVPIKLTNHTYDLEAMANAITDKTKMIFICNPNNPSGTFVNQSELDKFIDRVPESVLVVIDEAYFEFVDDESYPNSIKYVREGRPVIVTRTFSKIYGLAGLRIGYGVAPTRMVEADKKIRDPFNINLLAQAAALESLKHQDLVRQRFERNLKNKRFLYEAFDELGFEYVPSQTNFVLANVKKDSTLLFDSLLKKGIIVRTGEFFLEEYRNFIRVSVGTDEELKSFVSVLKEVV